MDTKTGARLWRSKVDTVAGRGPGGTPVQARYFRSMQLAPGGKALVIESEAGGVYRVDLASHVSTQISGPPESAALAPPVKPRPQPR